VGGGGERGRSARPNKGPANELAGLLHANCLEAAMKRGAGGWGEVARVELRRARLESLPFVYARFLTLRIATCGEAFSVN
jgi:hypothetical protein